MCIRDSFRSMRKLKDDYGPLLTNGRSKTTTCIIMTLSGTFTFQTIRLFYSRLLGSKFFFTDFKDSKVLIRQLKTFSKCQLVLVELSMIVFTAIELFKLPSKTYLYYTVMESLTLSVLLSVFLIYQTVNDSKVIGQVYVLYRQGAGSVEGEIASDGQSTPNIYRAGDKVLVREKYSPSCQPFAQNEQERANDDEAASSQRVKLINDPCPPEIEAIEEEKASREVSKCMSPMHPIPDEPCRKARAENAIGQKKEAAEFSEEDQDALRKFEPNENLHVEKNSGVSAKEECTNAMDFNLSDDLESTPAVVSSSRGSKTSLIQN
eukprot:TRINITY_DN10719_c0_g1_i20.p1 TRINITY_DN10719_c0_g1~~TRINITY_DN10719_c0_g1_i20.p1  ORF type:complete len:320 (-),score=50.20 TRINITY_DN10719_c0_g1_i20:192-1151(-)